MRDKINKIISIIKKDGILKACGKVYRYIKANYLSRINILGYLYIKINYKKIKKEISNILNGDYKRIIIWSSLFGWNVPLFQRPQHISKNFAKNECLVFYEVTTVTDKVKTFKKIDSNLYLINFNNRAIKKLLYNELKNVNKPKYIQFYSTDATISLQKLKEYMNQGYKVIYEYIDDLTPVLSGTKQLPKNIKDKYEYIMNENKEIFVVVTADEIQKDVESKRGTEKLVFSCNGVDYDHFNKIEKEIVYDKKFEQILQQNKPIIGYYGALASWFDYKMIKELAENRPNYNIVLLGIKYDDSFDKEELNKYENIYFLGSKKYEELPNYASKFNVCTIPFVINNITQATSPLKLFEYMALGKPIVTTAMKECKKYKSVMIANNNQEFIDFIDKAIVLEKNKDDNYYKILEKEALENTWESKAKAIINLIEQYETN